MHVYVVEVTEKCLLSYSCSTIGLPSNCFIHMVTIVLSSVQLRIESDSTRRLTPYTEWCVHNNKHHGNDTRYVQSCVTVTACTTIPSKELLKFLSLFRPLKLSLAISVSLFCLHTCLRNNLVHVHLIMVCRCRCTICVSM